MTASVRSKMGLTVAALVAVLVLAACGGGDSPSSSSDNGGESAADGRPQPEGRQQARQAGVRDQREGAVGARSTRRSTSTSRACERWKDPIQISLDGALRAAARRDGPGLQPRGGPAAARPGLRRVAAARRRQGVHPGRDDRLPAVATRSPRGSRRRRRRSDNGLTKTAGMFYINPQSWRKNTKIVGETDTAGEPTMHVTAGIRADRFFRDMSRLVDLLTALRVTEIVGPADGDHREAAGGARALGEDRQGRRLLRQGRPRPAQGASRRRTSSSRSRTASVLGGMTEREGRRGLQHLRGRRAAERSSAPSELGSYADLQLTLDALAEAIQQGSRHEVTPPEPVAHGRAVARRRRASPRASASAAPCAT